jgi:acetyl esterase/lipase
MAGAETPPAARFGDCADARGYELRHADGVAVRVYRPVGEPTDALQWAHGGGFVHGDLDMPEADWVARSLADRGHLVVSVDYRLASDTVRYPAPSNDVLAAWHWLTDNRNGLGVAGPLHLGGASAGGNLVTGAVVRMRDGDPAAAGAFLPHSLVLAYPTLHAVQPQASAELAELLLSLPEESRWDAEQVLGMYAGFLPGRWSFGDRASDPATLPVGTAAPPLARPGGTGGVGPAPSEPASEVSGRASPAEILRAAPAAAVPGDADLTGFPPTLIVTSETDGLRTSAEAFALRLADAGIEHEYFTEPGTLHGHLNRPLEPGALPTLERIHAWLTNHR